MLTEKQIDDLNEIVSHPKFIEQIITLTSTQQLNPDYLFHMLSETVVYMDEEHFYNFLALSETDDVKQEVYELLLPYCEQLINSVANDVEDNRKDSADDMKVASIRTSMLFTKLYLDNLKDSIELMERHLEDLEKELEEYLRK